MTKEDLRKNVWQLLEDNGVRCFPLSPSGHGVPNFVGADRAAQRLTELAVWKKARTLKVGADAPQLPVRRRALAEGKLLYMALPHLRTEKAGTRSATIGVSSVTGASTGGCSSSGVK